MKKEKRFTIGTDPEFFMVDRKTGKLLSAIPFVEGTKHEPQPLPSGGNVQRDNVAIEFATDPAKDGEDLVAKVRNAFTDIFKSLSPDHDIVAIPSANFAEDQLDHEEAREFGCEPDFNAWTMMMNEPPPEASSSTFRSCGAHLHVGHVKGDGNDFLLEIEGKILTVKMMDLFHGVISTVLDNSKSAVERRKLYGKAGCHRPTDYGVEYRVLSNFWMRSPMLVMLMDSLTSDILVLIREGKAEGLIDSVGEDRIQTIINEGEVGKAKTILEDVLSNHLSEDSRFYLEEALKKVNEIDIDIRKEWEMEA